MAKEFKTYQEQIEILKKKGLIIHDNTEVRRKLQRFNYYNVINGYKDLFLIPNEVIETFKPGTKFEELIALFKFDKKLKKIVLERLLKMENAVKSIISYVYSEEYGYDNYLKFNNFESLIGTSTKISTINKRIEQIHNLIALIQKTIADSCDKKKYINHYLIKYGFIPLWVLVNALPFGTISKFYGLLKQKEKIKIAMEFNLKYEDLDSFIKIMAFYRNICAHDEKLYNEKQDITSIPDTKYHAITRIKKTNGRYTLGKNDLFALYITLKSLMSNKEYFELKNDTYEAIKSLKSQLKTISIDLVLNEMGFPKNWRAIR